jgi:hypothetical protein
MKKKLLVLLLLVLCIPVITFAGDVPPGQPFQQLQSQIDMINNRLENLTRQLQDVGNKTATHDKEIAGLNFGFEGILTQIVGLGITHVIHGRSANNGVWLEGEHWTPIDVVDVAGSSFIYKLRLDTMTDETVPPHCVAIHSLGPSGLSMFNPPVLATSTVYGRDNHWELDVFSYYIDLSTGSPIAYLSQFDFICIQ